MRLFDRLFPKAAELGEANERIRVLAADKEELQKRNTNLWASYNARDATIQNLRTELASLKDRVREQTDADLLLVSARILMATLKGEKPSSADIDWQRRLMDQQRAMRNIYPYQSSGGVLGGLGDIAQALGIPRV